MYSRPTASKSARLASTEPAQLLPYPSECNTRRKAPNIISTTSKVGGRYARQEPGTTTQCAGAYLPLGPAHNLNEAQHRRTISFHSNMAYSILRFLSGGDYYHRGTTGHDSALLEPESHLQTYLQATILASLWQHILYKPMQVVQLSSLECNYTRCKNCQGKCIKSGI
jgi:hypothetical protein